MTAQDVADAAGVSRSAVSRAFSKTAYLDSDKRARVMETAKRLGYRPNALAASLQGLHTNLVAIVAGDLGNAYDAEFAGALVAALNAAGKWPLVLSGSDRVTQQSIRSVLRYPLDALIVRGGSLPTPAFENAAQLSIPVIYSGRVEIAPLVDCVCCENQAGARLAIDAMLAKGRRRFGYIGGPPDWSSERERLAGVQAALSDAGLTLSAQIQADYTRKGGRAAAQTLLAAHDLDALFCANDAMALGALSAARDAGSRVPQDLSIIGFDDMRLAAWPEFELSTIRNPISATVAEILRLLDARLADPTRAGEIVMIPPEFVARNTH